jgi:hypothetical protein
MRALEVLEYALAAPAPRRLRTWLHRVIVAVDALSTALEAADADRSLGILDEVPLGHPQYAAAVRRLRSEQTDLCIAAAALREQIQRDPEIPIDPAYVRTRRAALTQRYRQYRAREAELIYAATGVDIDEQRGSTRGTNDVSDGA